MQKKSRTEIVGDDLVMLGGKTGASAASARNGHATPQATEQLPGTTFSEEEISPEEIPF